MTNNTMTSTTTTTSAAATASPRHRSAAAAAKAKGHFLATAYAASLVADSADRADSDLSSDLPPPLSPDLLELDTALWALARMQDEDGRSVAAAHDQLDGGREHGHGHGAGHGLNLNFVPASAPQLAGVAAPANEPDASLGTPVGSPRKRPSLSDAAGVGARDRLRRLEGIAACIARCAAAGASEREILRVLLAEGDEDVEGDGPESGPGDITDDDDTTTDDDDDDLEEEDDDEDDVRDEEELAVGYRHFSRPRHGYRTTSSERVSLVHGGRIGLGLLDLDGREPYTACDLDDDHSGDVDVLANLYGYVIRGKTHEVDGGALAVDRRER